MERIAPRASRASGLVALIGAAAIVLADVVSIAIASDYSAVRQTISALAAGRHAWVMDLGIYLFAIGIGALAYGLFLWRRGHAFWLIGVAALGLLAIDLVVIAAVNQYQGTTNPGADVHRWAVYGLGILFGVAAFCLAPGLRAAGSGWVRFGFAVAITWAIVGPIFIFVPTGWDGALERFLAALVVLWVAMLGILLVGRSPGGEKPSPD